LISAAGYLPFRGNRQNQFGTLVTDVSHLLVYRPDFQAVIAAGFEKRQQLLLRGRLLA
jgi:hypothetical protein